ncbi:tetratricopeptide repeat protein 27 [Oratosquilla oratoria]|uniref:tetratricopeptide repeat protein 27 n=1 Tax=Oratosquilla oratoria TaxID=337810 RepID=UPI003F75C0F2
MKEDVFLRVERAYLYDDPSEHQPQWESLEGPTKEIAEKVAIGSYVEALSHEIVQRALGAEEPRPEGTSINAHYKNCLMKYLHNGDKEAHHEILCIGICCLQLFVQQNFTGPVNAPPPSQLLPGLVSEGKSDENIRNEALEELLLDTEGIYTFARGPEYMVVARTILIDMKELLLHCNSISWWTFRCAYIHQRVADERSPKLYEVVLQSLNDVENNEKLVSLGISRDLTALYHLEAGYVHLHYYDVGKAGNHFRTAEKALGITFSLTGALGKRTKWQQEDKAQLVLKVAYEGQPVMAQELPGERLLPTDLPADLLLEEDTRLHRVKYAEEDEDLVPDLRPIEQALILAQLMLRRRAQALDVQTNYETKSYLVALLQYPKNWSLQMSALIMRSKVEAGENRAMQRAMNQLEELVTSVSREEPSRFERLKIFYASQTLPHWELQQELACMLMRLGCVKSALEIFERLHLWEDVITCYNELQMRQRSAEVVRMQLEKGETPKLWCLLGDATDDLECYDKAWKLSNEKSARAQRCLGNYYYIRRNYKMSIHHYQKSLEINRLQFPVWQRLAYSALQAEEWQICAQAYRTCSVLEPECFDVWNNMAQAYLKLGETHRAWKSLHEAIRCRFDSWRVWDNFMLISTSLGYMEHALNAYKSILEHKEKHVDTEILGRIVKNIIEEKVDPDGREMKNLFRRCIELLGRLTSQVPTNPDLWELYGDLTSNHTEPTPETRHMAMQQYKKAVAAATQRGAWEKDTLSVVGVLFRAKKLLDASMQTVAGTGPKTVMADLSGVRLSVKAVITATKRSQINVSTGELVDDVKEPLQQVENGLEELVKVLDSLKL